ncbi:MAG: extracellular solute-binding protein [SAR324 cluster bacterium]|nr:extracellular solute-binding protein [SAR324 cluster bacterium]
MTKNIFLASIALFLFAGMLNAAEEKLLYVYNWSDYIAEETIAKFEKETGIKVTYDVFDSNEVLEAKLLAGKTGFDLVVPSSSFLGRQIKAGVFQKLDKKKLSNWNNLDMAMMETLKIVDPGNQYSIPYLWGTTGIGVNVGKLKAILGDSVALNSWDLLFKPEIVSKLSSCGVSLLDAPSEVLPAALHYLGKNPNSRNASDYTKFAQPLLEKIRPFVSYFHSSKYINDLANGDSCIAMGWSGDVIQAADRASEADNGVEILYIIPKEGAGMWFDMLAIPSDAKHPDNAHKFLDFLMRPEIIAEISNYVAYANGNNASFNLVDKEVREDKSIYPDAATKEKLYTFEVTPPKIDRVQNRVWTKIKTGK